MKEGINCSNFFYSKKIKSIILDFKSNIISGILNVHRFNFFI